MIIKGAKLNVTINDLKKRIDEYTIVEDGERISGLYAFIWDDSTQRNLKRFGVTFGCENFTDEDEQFNTPGFQAGYDKVGPIPVRWIATGDDSDKPIGFCIYINQYDELDVYVPCNGNVYDKKHKCAYYDYDNNDKYNQIEMRNEFWNSITYGRKEK